jgi:hypothetical protein
MNKETETMPLEDNYELNQLIDQLAQSYTRV